MKGPEVAGSLWSVPPDEQSTAAAMAVRVGLSRMHWDFADGRFATSGGFDASRAARLACQLADAEHVTHEAHLMIADTPAQVDSWTDLCDRIILHIETPCWREAAARIERRGCEVLVALSPNTPASAAPDELGVLCMSVTPGRAGSRFDRSALTKVAELTMRNPERELGLDGGMRRELVAEAAAAGVTWVVVGNDLFGAGGLARWTDAFG